jgi:hypothetical protein
MHSSQGGTYTGAGDNGQATDLGEITITAPKDPTLIEDPNDIVHHDVLPPTDTTTTPGGEGGWTTPVTPVFPTIPTTTTPTEGDGTGVGSDTNPIGHLQTYFGLGPGWIQAVPQYNTTSPVQARYYHGDQYFQQGPTFNSALASRGINQPQQAWGLQQMYTPMTPQQFAQVVQQPLYQQATYQQPTPAAQPQAQFVAQPEPRGPTPLPMPVQYAPIVSAPVLPAPDGIPAEDLMPYPGVTGPVAPVPA